MSDALPDEHYRTVADLYENHRRAAGRPNAVIADLYDVPKTTADRWVKRAKQLGFLRVTPICRGRCPACCPPEQTRG